MNIWRWLKWHLVCWWNEWCPKHRIRKVWDHCWECAKERLDRRDAKYLEKRKRYGIKDTD